MRMKPVTILLCLAATGFPLGGAAIIDTFDDNSLNLSLWQPLFVNLNREIPPGPAPGGSISEVNQRLEITGIGNVPGEPGSTGDFFVGVALLGLVDGDFDIQVGYSLLSDLDGTPWEGDPPVLGLFWFGQNVNTPDYNPSYLLRGNGLYGAASAHSGNVVPTSDQSGRLRVTRIDTTYSAYYSNGGEWQLLHSAPEASAQPADFYLGVAGHGLVTVSAAFDDFQLRTGPFPEVPEPGSFALAAIALGIGIVLGGRPARSWSGRRFRFRLP